MAGRAAARQAAHLHDHVAVADGLGDRRPGRHPTGSPPAGLSAGGLLQGAVLSQRPDRWRAVVAEVPFVDVVTTMLDDTIPLTVNEWDEWGDPHVRADFDAMLAYSPYDNLPPAGGRPDLLVTGAVHDARVMVREPAKWVARAARVGPGRGRHAACSGSRPAPAPTWVRAAASGTSPTRPRCSPGCWTGSASPTDPAPRVAAWTSGSSPSPSRARRTTTSSPWPQTTERLGFDAFFRSDHYLAHGHRRAARPDGRLGDAGRPGPRHQQDPARHPGHLGDLPAARARSRSRWRASTR